MQNECSLLWVPVSLLFLFCAILPRALNVLKEAKWEEVKEHGEGVGKGIAPSSPCDVVYLPKKWDTTHFQDEDQAAASIYSTASAVFSSLDAIPEIVSQTPAVNIVTKCIPHKSTSKCKWPCFLLCA